MKLSSNTICGLLLVFVLSFGVEAFAQLASLSGRVTSDGKPVPFANVFLQGTEFGASTNIDGIFVIENIPVGTYISETSAVGYVSFMDNVIFSEGENLIRNYFIQEDVFSLSQAVVTGSRSVVKRHHSPVIVNTINAKTFETTQSITISEGLSYSPGLRMENNCQNCGFTQLRINGLDGPYSQILINSRPIFSALAGVYGLEMLPSNMVDRIEVVRGGGSVMYGGNAIAGTVNIITKNPFENTFEAGLNQSFINGETSDRTVNFNGSVVSEDLNQGIAFFGFNRDRDRWDANDDGFSESVQLRSNTFGLDAFYHFCDRNKLKFGAYYITEFRRGGVNAAVGS